MLGLSHRSFYIVCEPDEQCSETQSGGREARLPERTIVIELAADLISSFCEAHRR